MDKMNHIVKSQRHQLDLVPDKDDLPHQSSVMAIVRERLRTAHGVERNDS